MSFDLKVLSIQPTTEIPDLLVKALDQAFFEKIRMQPITVLIQPMIGDWAGCCGDAGTTVQNEVTLVPRMFERRSGLSEQWHVNNIRATYLHECAHRLSNQRHFGGFLVTNLILHIRADLIQQVGVYDWHEEPHFAEVFAWAYACALKYAHKEMGIEECVSPVLQEYRDWSNWMDGAADRAAEEEVKAASQAAQNADAQASRKAAAKAQSDKVRSLKQDRWFWSLYTMVITVLLLTFLTK